MLACVLFSIPLIQPERGGGGGGEEKERGKGEKKKKTTRKTIKLKKIFNKDLFVSVCVFF